MERISWDDYNSAVNAINLFERRSPINTAKKYAKKALEKLAKEYGISYEELVRSLLEK